MDGKPNYMNRHSLGCRWNGRSRGEERGMSDEIKLVMVIIIIANLIITIADIKRM